MGHLLKDEYERMVACCDVGLIFLDYRFTILVFPSRLLSYMQAKLPVQACTDSNTHIGQIITEGGFGWWCERKEAGNFVQVIGAIQRTQLKEIGTAAFEYMQTHYTVEAGCQAIMHTLSVKKR